HEALYYASTVGISEPRRYRRCGLRGGHNGNDLEVSDVVPVCHPLIEQAAILTFHYLEAAAQILGDPTSPILDPFRHQAPSIAESSVHRYRIAAPEVLDDHVEHGVPQANWIIGAPVS